VAMDDEQELAPALPMSAEVHPNKPIGDFDPSADINVDLDAPSVHRKARTGFMTDKGSAFPLVAKHFGWTHLLDRRHFATQILSAWNGLSDPKKFQSDVYKILDSPCVETMNLLLKQALSKYCTDKAQAFRKKILDKQHQLCYSHTCCTFTAGRVSDQRMEWGIAAIKANRKLKSMLSKCNYGKAISQISQCARDQDINALKELQNCCQQHKKVGIQYADALNNSNIASIKYSFIKQTTQGCSTQLSIKESESSTVACFVNLDKNISWIGKDFQIVTGTCSYYTSTWMICPCACAVMQCIGWDIDKIENVHPFYHLRYHPLWKEALKSLQLSVYKDSSFYISPLSNPTSSNVTDTLICPNTEDTMRRVNFEIFEKIDIYGNISKAQRIAMMRQHFYKLEKIAV
jgi:hypothetical protein